MRLAEIPWPPPIATGSSPRRWRCATGSSDRWLHSARDDSSKSRKRVYYLSLEFLIGRLFWIRLNNSGLTGPMRLALGHLGVDLERLRAVEPDAGARQRRSRAAGRLFHGEHGDAWVSLPTATAFATTWTVPQVIRDGWQHEYPENWLSLGNPWEFERPDVSLPVSFGGWVEAPPSADGTAVPSGTRTRRCSPSPTTRRWWAGAAGTRTRCACGRHARRTRWRWRRSTGAITSAHWPRDHRRMQSRKSFTPATRHRLARNCGCVRSIFFSSASLQDLLHRHIQQYGELHSLPDKCAIQLNDTHPAIVVPELMRLLVDQHGQSWAEAWRITTNTISYTNHTLLPEALETWPVPLMERLLPRHMQIIYEINKPHLDSLRDACRPDMLLAEVSVIDEAGDRRVRMGTLAFLGSHKVNGVSALHTELMRRTVFQSIATRFTRTGSSTRPTASHSAAG